MLEQLPVEVASPEVLLLAGAAIAWVLLSDDRGRRSREALGLLRSLPSIVLVVLGGGVVGFGVGWQFTTAELIASIMSLLGGIA